jgi:hypothetical protein
MVVAVPTGNPSLHPADDTVGEPPMEAVVLRTRSTNITGASRAAPRAQRSGTRTSSPWLTPVAAALRRAVVLIVALGVLVAVLVAAPGIPAPPDAASHQPSAGPNEDTTRYAEYLSNLP